MKNLSKFGVQELDAMEVRTIEGGNMIDKARKLLKAYKKAWEYYKKNFDPNVLPISKKSTGTALDGYMGCKM